MRKLSVLLLVGVVLLFTSCDKFTNLKIPAPLTATFDFAISSSTDNTINKVETVNLSDVPDLQQYLDQIDGLTIKAIKIEITEYADSSAKDCTLDGTIKYSATTSTTPIDLATATALNLNDMFVNKTKYDCPGVVAEYQNVANELINNGSVKLYINGTSTAWPAVGKAKITIEAEATVKLFQ